MNDIIDFEEGIPQLAGVVRLIDDRDADIMVATDGASFIVRPRDEKEILAWQEKYSDETPTGGVSVRDFPSIKNFLDLELTMVFDGGRLRALAQFLESEDCRLWLFKYQSPHGSSSTYMLGFEQANQVLLVLGKRMKTDMKDAPKNLHVWNV